MFLGSNIILIGNGLPSPTLRRRARSSVRIEIGHLDGPTSIVESYATRSHSVRTGQDVASRVKSLLQLDSASLVKRPPDCMMPIANEHGSHCFVKVLDLDDVSAIVSEPSDNSTSAEGSDRFRRLRAENSAPNHAVALVDIDLKTCIS
jgi:hypothetical protein